MIVQGLPPVLYEAARQLPAPGQGVAFDALLTDVATSAPLPTPANALGFQDGGVFGASYASTAAADPAEAGVEFVPNGCEPIADRSGRAVARVDVGTDHVALAGLPVGECAVSSANGVSQLFAHAVPTAVAFDPVAGESFAMPLTDPEEPAVEGGEPIRRAIDIRARPAAAIRVDLTDTGRGLVAGIAMAPAAQPIDVEMRRRIADIVTSHGILLGNAFLNGSSLAAPGPIAKGHG